MSAKNMNLSASSRGVTMRPLRKLKIRLLEARLARAQVAAAMYKAQAKALREERLAMPAADADRLSTQARLRANALARRIGQLKT